MKDLIRAQQLIDELKSLADNHFELHRISVLEKDLTAPPVVEVIDDNHQKFNGEIYHKSKDNHYYKSTTLQRAIFDYYFGIADDNQHVHHIDFNPSNNNVENLILMSQSEHRQIHFEDMHSKRKNYSHICQTCGKSFMNKVSYSKFCSRKCQAAAFNKKKRNEPKICQHCGKTFMADCRFNSRFCSHSCAQKELMTGAVNKKSIPNKTLATLDIDSIATATNLVCAFCDNPIP